RDVEREAARLVAADPRFGRVAEELANLVPDADVGRGARARSLTDRRLIELEHADDALPTLYRLDVRERRRLAALRRHEPREVAVKHIADQRALAAAADTGHAHEPRAAQSRVEPKEVVARDALELEPAWADRVVGGGRLAVRGDGAARLQWVAGRRCEHAPRRRSLGSEEGR